jgi:hypothetical protein
MVHTSHLLSVFGASSLLLAQQEPPPTQPTTEIVVSGVRKLTVGGQYRLRYENQTDLDLDDDTRPDTNDFFSQRARFSLGFDFSDRLAFFLQVQDAREWGEEATTLDDTADGLDMHQAWVELRDLCCLGGTLRLGRQEMVLGDQRLVGALDWKTQARSFDGIHQKWTCERDTLQAWAMQVRETITPATVNDDQWFVGLQGTRKFDDALLADLYLMLLHDDGLTPGTSASRYTLGTRWVWKSASWEAGAELATQFGEQAGADIPIGDAYAAHVHLTRSFDGDKKPWVRAELNVASGDDPATADRERFVNLFPTVHAHWGMMDVANWENLWNPMLQFGIKPCDKCDLALSWNWFRAMEGRDSFGGPNATLIAANTTDSRTIGNEIDLVWTRALDLGTSSKTTFQLGYGVFLPGAAPDAVGRDTAGHFAYAQFDLRF